jgi:uncharacterized protein (TIGR00290 family)
MVTLPVEFQQSHAVNHTVRDIALAWSGGKDSALTLAALQRDPAYRVVALVTTTTTEFDRISIHGVRRTVLAAQVAAIGLPLFEAPIAPGASNDDYERSFADALARVQSAHPGARQIAFGDLFLTDVRAYREALLGRLGWTGVFPLWLRDTTALARAFVEGGFKAILCCVDTTQLGAEFAGREYDINLLTGLPPGVDPCGEGGEFHTCVYGGPIFTSGLQLVRGKRVLRDHRFQYCDLSLAE